MKKAKTDNSLTDTSSANLSHKDEHSPIDIKKESPKAGSPKKTGETNSDKTFFHHLAEFFPIDYWFAAFCASFCLTSFVTLLVTPQKYTELAFAGAVSISTFILTLLIFFGGIIAFAVFSRTKQTVPIALLVSSLCFSSALAYFNQEQIYVNIGIALVLFLVVSWVAKDDKIGIHRLNLPTKSLWLIAALGALLFTLLVSYASISRYNAFMAHNFDFGIFTQMFEKMRTTGLPDTTVERNTLMSHFGVHFSPFYYLLLPFYALVPRPETLLVLQAAFVAAGVFAVVMLCRKLELSKNITLAFICIYLFFPSLSNGCLYDFHENKFLTVLLLWTTYFVLSKNTKLLFLFAILTLTVKEDAAIYVLAIALYIIVGQREYIKGGILFVLSGIYFVFATGMVALMGDGIMIDRLSNYVPQGESGFLAVAKTCFTNFGYFITQVFTPDKIAFMFWMFLPLAFAPFMGKKKTLLLLLVPMLVVDLMSNWEYQYHIDYQYTFGVAALLVFMAVVAVKGMKRQTRQTVVMLSAALCIVMSFSLFFPRAAGFIKSGKSMQSLSASYHDLIDTIPKDKSITADSNYIPHMYDFEDMYMYPNYYAESKKTEYLLVSSYSVQQNVSNLATFMGDDYELLDTANAMQLYKLK